MSVIKSFEELNDYEVLYSLLKSYDNTPNMTYEIKSRLFADLLFSGVNDGAYPKTEEEKKFAMDLFERGIKRYEKRLAALPPDVLSEEDNLRAVAMGLYSKTTKGKIQAHLDFY